MQNVLLLADAGVHNTTNVSTAYVCLCVCMCACLCMCVCVCTCCLIKSHAHFSFTPLSNQRILAHTMHPFGWHVGLLRHTCFNLPLWKDSNCHAAHFILYGNEPGLKYLFSVISHSCRSNHYIPASNRSVTQLAQTVGILRIISHRKSIFPSSLFLFNLEVERGFSTMGSRKGQSV